MSGGSEPAERLVITAEELRDPRVDERLARQLSFGMAPAEARQADARTSLLQRPWFALMLAGLVGALAAWAVTAPFVVDGLRFEGTLQEVSGNLGSYPRLKVGDVHVLVLKEARILEGGKRIGVEALRTGQLLRVQGQPVHGTSLLAAWEIQVLGSGGPEQKVNVLHVSLQHMVASFLFFPIVAALVGLFIGATDGLLSRAFRRSVTCGLVGMGIGLSAGLLATVLAEVVYGLGRTLVARFETGDGDPGGAAFVIQMMVRGVAWSLAGAAMGLGQGVALRSKKLTLNGLIGGTVGALLGGLLFDPIDLWVSGRELHSATLSRAVGLGVIGAVTGLMIGLVELLAREAWLKMLTGPIAGKEFILYKNPTLIGSSPKSDVYLFKDPEVEPTHAELRQEGESYVLIDRSTPAGTFVNGRRASRTRLRSGDQVRIGKTVFNYSEKDS